MGPRHHLASRLRIPARDMPRRGVIYWILLKYGLWDVLPGLVYDVVGPLVWWICCGPVAFLARRGGADVGSVGGVTRLLQLYGSVVALIYSW